MPLFSFLMSNKSPPSIKSSLPNQRQPTTGWLDLPLEIKLKITHSLGHDARKDLEQHHHELGDIGRTLVKADTALQNQQIKGYPAKRTNDWESPYISWSKSQTQMCGKYLAYITYHRSGLDCLDIVDLETNRRWSITSDQKILSMVLTDKILAATRPQSCIVISLEDLDKTWRRGPALPTLVIRTPLHPPMRCPRPDPNVSRQGKRFAFTANHKVYIWDGKFTSFDCTVGGDHHGILLLDDDVYVFQTSKENGYLRCLVQQYRDGKRINWWSTPLMPGYDGSNRTKTIAVKPTGDNNIWQLITPKGKSFLLNFEREGSIPTLSHHNTRLWKTRIYDSKANHIQISNEWFDKLGYLVALGGDTERSVHGVLVNEHYLVRYERCLNPEKDRFESWFTSYSFDYQDNGERASSMVVLEPRPKRKAEDEGEDHVAKKRKAEDEIEGHAKKQKLA